MKRFRFFLLAVALAGAGLPAPAQEFTRATRFDVFPYEDFVISGTVFSGANIVVSGESGIIVFDSTAGFGGYYTIDSSEAGGATYPRLTPSYNFVVFGNKRFGPGATPTDLPLIALSANMDGSTVVGLGGAGVVGLNSMPAYAVISPEPNAGAPVAVPLTNQFPGYAIACSAGGQTIVGMAVSDGVNSQGFIAKPSQASGTVPNTFAFPLDPAVYKSSTFYAVSADPFAYVVAGEAKKTAVGSRSSPLVLVNGAPIDVVPFAANLNGGQANAVSAGGEIVGGEFDISDNNNHLDSAFISSRGQTVSARTFLVANGMPPERIAATAYLRSVTGIGITRTTITLIGQLQVGDDQDERSWMATVPNNAGYLSDELITSYWRGSQAFNKAYGGARQSLAEAAVGYNFLAYYQYYQDMVDNPANVTKAHNDLYKGMSFYLYLYYLARGDTANAYAGYNYYQSLVQ